MKTAESLAIETVEVKTLESTAFTQDITQEICTFKCREEPVQHIFICLGLGLTRHRYMLELEVRFGHVDFSLVRNGQISL